MQIGEIMGLAVSKGAAVSQFIAQVLDSKPFRNCGIVPGDDEAPKYAEKRQESFVLKPPVESSMLIHEGGCDYHITVGRVKCSIVFTDGSVLLPRSPWLAHAGWGLHAGANSRANDWGKPEGPPFTSYRAELRGVVEAFNRAATPVCVYCDDQAVVNKVIE